MEMNQILIRKDEFGVSDYSDDESFDESIKASIERIRKEASRMDLYIALDQIDFLREENGAVKSELQSREDELDVLKERVSSLTMERDMLMADTNNLREDMTTLVEKMFEISCIAGSSSLADSTQSTVHHDDNLSQIVEGDKIPPDVMIVNEPFKSMDSSQNGDYKLLTRWCEGVNGVTKFTKEAQSSSSAMQHTSSRCSTSTDFRRSSVSGSTSEYQYKNRLVSSPSRKKSDEVHPVFTLRPVERKRTFLRRLLRTLTSCSRSNQVAALQDQLDQLQSTIRLSIVAAEQLQMRIELSNQNSLEKSPC